MKLNQLLTRLKSKVMKAKEFYKKYKGSTISIDNKMGILCGYNEEYNYCIMAFKDDKGWERLNDYTHYINKKYSSNDFKFWYFLPEEKSLFKIKESRIEFWNDIKIYLMIILTMVAGFITLFFGEYILDELLKAFPKSFVILSIWASILSYGTIIYSLWPTTENHD